MTAVLRLAFLLLVLSALAGCGEAQEAVPSRFKPGQAWSYTGRPGEEASRVLVLKVEVRPPHGTVVHIAVDRLSLANPRGATAAERRVTVIAHIPISEAALDASVLALLGDQHAVPPDWKRGYGRWLRGYREKAAGVYTRPLQTVIEQMAKGLDRPPATSPSPAAK